MDKETQWLLNYRFFAEDGRRKKAWNNFVWASQAGQFFDIPSWQQPPATLAHWIGLLWRWFTRQWTDGSRYFWPVFFMLAGYALIIWGLYAAFGDDLKPFEDISITSWDDRRSLGFAVAGFLAPPLAAIGYFLSSRRTQAMQDGNDTQRSMQITTLFIESQNLINANGAAAVGAISVLVRLGMDNGDLRDACKNQLIACLKTFARKNDDSHRLSGDEFLPHIEAALNGLCALQNHLRDKGLQTPKIELVNLDFSNVRLQSQSSMTSFTFKSCAFNLATLDKITFYRTDFLDCDFSGASLTFCKFSLLSDGIHARLHGSVFTNTNISRTYFSGTLSFTREQLSKCRYFKHFPPLCLKVPEYPIPEQNIKLTKLVLPTPWELSGSPSKPDEGRYLTLREAEEFWSSDGNGSCRPSHQDGEPIEIIDPYADDTA